MTEPASLLGAASSGVFWSAIESIGHRMATTVVFLVLARLLEPEAFGLVALAAVVVALMSVFVDQGFGSALVQRIDPEPEHFNTAFWISLGTAIGLAGIVVAGAPPLSDLFGQPKLEPVLRWLALMPILAALGSVPNAILRRELAFRSLAKRQLVGAFVGGSAGIAAAALGFGVWSLVTQTLVSSAVSTVVVWTCCPWRPGLKMSRRHFSDLFGFSSNVLGANLLSFANRRTDDLLIGAVLGPVALGLYSVAYRVLIVMTDVFTRTLAAVAFPVFSKVQSDLERVARGYLKATQLSATIAVPAFAFVAVMAPEIVVTVFGPKWKESIPVMQALASVGVLHSVLFFNTSVLMALGKANWALRLSMMTAAANVVGFAVAVHWGILAVAIAYAVRAYLLAPVPVVVVSRLLGFRLTTYVKQFVSPLVSTGAMAAALVIARAQLDGVIEGAPLLALSILLAIAVYAGALRALNPQLARELIEFVTAGSPRIRARRRSVALAGESGAAR